MEQPIIKNIEWGDVEGWLRGVADNVECDTIVGISRAGLPMAVALSYLIPGVRLSIMLRTGPKGPKPSLYDFDADRSDRREELLSTFVLASLPVDAKKILVVDDVATFGDTLAVAEAKVREKAPAAIVTFCAFAADTNRLQKSLPDVLRRLRYDLDIDNAKVWISFPWNLVP